MSIRAEKKRTAENVAQMEKVFMKPASKVLIHIAKNGKEGLAVI
jgi:hypothetical protein